VLNVRDPSKKSRTQWIAGFAVVTALFLLGAYILPALASQDGDDGDCAHPVKAQRVKVAAGENPSRHPWKVFASLDAASECDDALLGWQFLPSGVPRGSWNGKWSIRRQGHLPEKATISARDESADFSRVLSGIVGGDIQTVLARTKSGELISIHPKRPAARLLHERKWLMGVRYFMRFYPTGDPVSKVQLLDSDGKPTYSITGFEGSFEGPMGNP
jgi:hypothetical protein